VSHLVVTDDEYAGTLAGLARFRRVWSDGPITIFAVLPRDGYPSPASLLATDAPASGRLVRASPERLRVEVKASDALDATVAVAWSPKWHARLDGEPVALSSSTDGLIALRLPPGRSTLVLAYRTDVWDRLGVALSLTTLAVLGACAVVGPRRRRASI
jgi:hypothetical protein